MGFNCLTNFKATLKNTTRYSGIKCQQEWFKLSFKSHKEQQHYEKSPCWSSQVYKPINSVSLNQTTFSIPRCNLIQQRSFHSHSLLKNNSTTEIPDFSDYKKEGGDYQNRAFAYMMIGTAGLISTAAAKSTVHDFLTNLSASADVLALAKVEIDLSNIPEGKNVVIKWRGKPIFIRHRTSHEINEANKVSIASLRHPEQDTDRTKKPEWLIMIGICTHLGCVPIGESGDFGGWYCPCHGSHYDISGRIRRGPAPFNLEVPQYDFIDDQKVVIG